MPTRPRKALPEPARSSTTMVHRAKPGQTAAEAGATVAVAGLASNAGAMRDWSTQLGDVDATACLQEVTEAAARVTRGDLAGLEALLTAQALSLNALYTDLARRARTSTTLDPFERYLRLAMKAQGQCRATCETLAVLKNPPVFARQANIAHGPQQVNNALTPPSAQPLLARAENHEPGRDTLLEAARHGERMDGETAVAPSGRDPALAPAIPEAPI